MTSVVKIMTKNPFRGSFVHLNEPVLPHGETDQSKKKYQMTIALPKNDPFWQLVVQQQDIAAKEKFGGVVPANIKYPTKDGDNILNDDGTLKYPEFEGCYTLQLSSKRKPDTNKLDASNTLVPIIDVEELYSGAWYRVCCTAWAWTHATGGKGVSFSVDTVMKVKDDEPLSGGGGIAADDFAAYADQASPQTLDQGGVSAATLLS